MANINFLPPWVETNEQPAFYDKESGTVLQQTARMYAKVNQLVRSVNEQNETIADYIQQFIDLREFVEDYFENLDVQEEINNKLDEMAQDGSLTALIKAYVDPYIEAQDLVIANYKNDIDTEFSEYQTSVNSTLSGFNNAIQSLASGSPLVASSTAGMTDTTRVYVNTTDGKWYYYDGDSWEIGGTYQASEIADESVTLDKLADDTKYNLNSRINDKDKTLINPDVYYIDINKLNFVHYDVNLSTGDIDTVVNNKILTSTEQIYVPEGFVIESENADGLNVAVCLYDEDFDLSRNQRMLLNQGNEYYHFFAFPTAYKYCRLRITNIATTDIDVSSITDVKLKLVRFINPVNHNTKGNNLANQNVYVNGYLYDADGYRYNVSSSYKTLQPIKLKANTEYYIQQFRKFKLLNTDFSVIAGSFVDANTSNYTFTTTSECYAVISVGTGYNAFMVEGSTGDYEPYIEQLPPYIQLTNTDNLVPLITAQNVLNGKKYIALGDSFTHGDFTNAPEDDYHIEGGIYDGQLKVYPYIIGNRNSMIVNNLASNGMTITQINDEWSNYLSDSVLQQIPSDVDYITIKLGINDDASHRQANIGNINSNSRQTYYGAWNYVMNYLITNFPNAKIGIIVSNGISQLDYITPVIEIAHKWGVPYLNESTDPQVPLLIRTLRDDVLSSVKTARNNYWFVSTDPETPNSHPNAKCHEYESTIVENFLRSL